MKSPFDNINPKANTGYNSELTDINQTPDNIISKLPVSSQVQLFIRSLLKKIFTKKTNPKVVNYPVIESKETDG